MKPVRIGICGLGGYAALILKYLERDSAVPNPPVHLLAACEPAQGIHAGKIKELQARGIKVSARFEDFLAEPTEAVWLPVPIQLHRPFTEQALRAGKAVMCEKPIAGTIDELNAMIAGRDRTGLPVAVGFQDIYEPATQRMKKLLKDGAIGKIRSVTVLGKWSRDSAYYSRNTWAGKLRAGDAWVLDSPAQNALAHFIALPLFLLGPTPETADTPAAVEAELYRANPIENYDTCALRVQTAGGVSVLVLYTHACSENADPKIILHGDRGTLSCRINKPSELRTLDGHVETLDSPSQDRVAMIQRFAKLIRGIDDPQSHVATLEVARAHLLVVNGASEAAPVHTIPDSAITVQQRQKVTLRAVRGIEELFDACFREQRMPHETGLANWTQPSGRRDLRDFNHFSGPAQA